MTDSNDIKERLRKRVSKAWPNGYEYEAAVDDGHGSAEPGYDAELDMRAADHIAALERQVAEQQAVIDKLPKCWRLDDSGELVKDTAVAPGMMVYGPNVRGSVFRLLVCEIGFDGKPYLITDHGRWTGSVYLTGEAAQAAARGEQK